METPPHPKRPWAIRAAFLGYGMLVVYVAIIVRQGGETVGTILPWALLIGVGPTLALAASRVHDNGVARSLLVGSAAVSGVLGVLALFTIGIGLLLAAAVAAIGAIRPLSAH